MPAPQQRNADAGWRKRSAGQRRRRDLHCAYVRRKAFSGTNEVLRSFKVKVFEGPGAQVPRRRGRPQVAATSGTHDGLRSNLHV